MVMGNLEKKSKLLGKGKGGHQRRRELRNIILECVGWAGVLAIGLVVPNIVGAMGKLGIISTKRDREYINESCKRLIRKGLLVKENGFLRVTSMGSIILTGLQTSRFKPRKPTKWDRKWRILMFDIPENKHAVRDRLRRTLSTMGFVQLQKSVWIFPYDCEDIVSLLKADLRMGTEMLYIIAESIEDEEYLLNHFHL